MYIYINFSKILARNTNKSFGSKYRWYMLPPPKNRYGICDFCIELSNCVTVCIVPKFFYSKVSNILLCKKCLFEFGKQRYIYIYDKSHIKVDGKRTLKQRIKIFWCKFRTFFQKPIPEDEIMKYDNRQNTVEETQDDEIMEGNDSNLTHQDTWKYRRTNALGSLRKFNEEEYIPKQKGRRSGVYGSLKIFTDK